MVVAVIHFFDNGTSLTVEWRNVTLVDQPSLGKFSFQATLKETGDIVFAYGSIPGKISDISNGSHPVKIGISDAYTINHDILCESTWSSKNQPIEQFVKEFLR